MLTGIRKGVSINYCIPSLGVTMHTLATSALLLFTAVEATKLMLHPVIIIII